VDRAKETPSDLERVSHCRPPADDFQGNEQEDRPFERLETILAPLMDVASLPEPRHRVREHRLVVVDLAEFVVGWSPSARQHQSDDCLAELIERVSISLRNVRPADLCSPPDRDESLASIPVALDGARQ
jgi:hypothetical protein